MRLDEHAHGGGDEPRFVLMSHGRNVVSLSNERLRQSS
jgi:hypothetical protein